MNHHHRVAHRVASILHPYTVQHRELVLVQLYLVDLVLSFLVVKLIPFGGPASPVDTLGGAASQHVLGQGGSRTNGPMEHRIVPSPQVHTNIRLTITSYFLQIKFSANF